MRQLFILFCCLLFNGCFLLGPSYHKPKINIPKQWPHGQQVKQQSAIDLPEFYWWKQFNNPALNGYIKKALKENYQLNIARTNIEYAASQLQQIKLSWLPTAAILGGYSQFPILGNPGTFVIAYPQYIVNILQLYKQQKSAQAVFEASNYARDCAKLIVIAQVTTSFFTLLAQQEAAQLYQQLLRDYQRYLKLVTSQFYSGITSADDIEKISSELRQIQAQFAVIQHNIIVSKNTLHYLANENPGELVVNTPFKSLKSNPIVPKDLPVCVLRARPDVQQAEALMRAAHAEIGAIKASLLPSVTLGSYLGEGSAIKGNMIRLGQAYLIGPAVDLPIFAQIDATKARYKGLVINYIDVVRKALRDVSDDLSAYANYGTQFTNNKLALQDERRYCVFTQQRYKHGLVDNVDVIRCNIRLDYFALVLNQSKLEKMLALVTLYQDLAGGYHVT